MQALPKEVKERYPRIVQDHPARLSVDGHIDGEFQGGGDLTSKMACVTAGRSPSAITIADAVLKLKR